MNRLANICLFGIRSILTVSSSAHRTLRAVVWDYVRGCARCVRASSWATGWLRPSHPTSIDPWVGNAWAWLGGCVGQVLRPGQSRGLRERTPTVQPRRQPQPTTGGWAEGGLQGLVGAPHPRSSSPVSARLVPKTDAFWHLLHASYA